MLNPLPAKQRIAAFFDLDSTLLAVNSGALWIRRERRLNRVTRRQYAQAIAYLLGYRLSIIDMQAAMRKALQTIKGEQEQVLRAWTRQWYYEEVARHVAPGGRRALFAHRRAGHRLVLLSTTSPYEAEVVREHLSLDAVICTGYEVRDHVFTGEPMLPLCYGPGKVTLAEQYGGSNGIDLDQSFFYSDSFSDVPMLERVAHPRAVNPDLRLWTAARRRGWPILDWRDSRACRRLPGLAPVS